MFSRQPVQMSLAGWLAKASMFSPHLHERVHASCQQCPQTACLRCMGVEAEPDILRGFVAQVSTAMRCTTKCGQLASSGWFCGRCSGVQMVNKVHCVLDIQKCRDAQLWNPYCMCMLC